MKQQQDECICVEATRGGCFTAPHKLAEKAKSLQKSWDLVWINSTREQIYKQINIFNLLNYFKDTCGRNTSSRGEVPLLLRTLRSVWSKTTQDNHDTVNELKCGNDIQNIFTHTGPAGVTADDSYVVKPRKEKLNYVYMFFLFSRYYSQTIGLISFILSALIKMKIMKQLSDKNKTFVMWDRLCWPAVAHMILWSSSLKAPYYTNSQDQCF